MQNMINDVYTALKTSTANIQKKIAEYRAMEEKEKSGVYSADYVRTTLRPKMRELRDSIERDKAAAISGARDIVTAYQDELRDKDNLHPEDITEDAKLFTAGVRLTARDINAILARNEGNGTMEQLALRYASENGIDIGRKYYYGHQREIQEAEGVTGILHYYEKWIDKDNAGKMLDRFFGIEPAGQEAN